jgi:hypothetical protein
MRSIFFAGLGLLLLSPRGLAETLPTDSPHRPLIFQYVTPFQDGDTRFSSVMALSPAHMTTAAAENPLFDGITLIIPWSILEPKPGQVDFGVLDAPLDYWGKKGKKVILNVAPITFPTVLGKAWGGKLTGGTPDWVMKESAAMVVPNVRLLYPLSDKFGPALMPSAGNPAFESAYFDLIAQLGKKYNGDPRLAVVRIGTGNEGEEHPQYNKGLQDVLPGFTNKKWYAYCTDTVKAYVQAFPGSPLEIDLDWAGVAYLQDKDGSRAEVENLIALLKRDHVALGNNGWRGTPPPNKSAYTAIDQLIRQFHDDGYPVALEVGGPAQSPWMWDTAGLLKFCQRLEPMRVNFMGNTASIINYAEGIDDPRDAVSIALYRKAVLAKGGDPLAIAKKFRDLIVAIREMDVPPASRR